MSSTRSADELVDQLILGRVLKHYRRAAGLTQDELAGYTGVSQSTITRIERGDAVPDVLLFWKLCGFFDVSSDQIRRVWRDAEIAGLKQAKLANETDKNWSQIYARWGHKGVQDFVAAGVTVAVSKGV